MKRLLFYLMLLSATSVFAQDVIVKKDGSTILSKVQEINENNVKYKKFSNLQGPTYTMGKADILSINYENGDKDDFSEMKNLGETSTSTGEAHKLVNKTADFRNTEILALYNRNYTPTAKAKVKKGKTVKNNGQKTLALSYSGICMFGVSLSSIMSNEDIEMTFVKEIRSNPNNDNKHEECVYNIQLKNKTNKTIYIDKGNCFRIENNGEFHCYFNETEQLNVSTGNNSGGSLGLGSITSVLGIGGKIGLLANGVSVGGGSSRNVTKSYSQQRIIAIPPQGMRNLCVPNFVKTSGYKVFGDVHSVHETIEDAESFECIYDKKENLEDFFVPYGTSKLFDEKDSPYQRKYIITYSIDEHFSSYSTIEAHLYIRQIVGTQISDSFSKYRINPERYIEEINDYTIYTGFQGCDYYIP